MNQRALRLAAALLSAGLPALATGAPGQAATKAIDPDNPAQGRLTDDWMLVRLNGADIGYAHSTLSRDNDLMHAKMSMHIAIGPFDGARQSSLLIRQ